jgi:hypothetical protein
LKKTIGIILSTLWGIYALTFGYFGLVGFGGEVSKEGLRKTLCGKMGCSNIEYYGSLTWLIGIVVLTYIIPLIIIIFWIRKSKKG